MSISAHGVDMVECNRIAESVERFGETFLDRVYTPRERDYCYARKNPVPHLAGRFAAKEAVLKVLGTGWTNGIAWTDIEVRNDAAGRPSVHLDGRCRAIADEQGLATIHISISHIATHAIASAIGVGTDPSGTPGVLGMGG
ncbi:MAG: holo-[acyl-carrier-protein] synthase [Planctomycetes bacterium]|jgi:holo-[acyl-carrier protein] synthase|nr:holo-ACP synthase [Phycisphaerae bacterium]NBB96360.1 holo-[acyl-carrier-protein] synthase [Planctomycetota bacterium]